MKLRINQRDRHSRRGSALLVALITTVVLAGMAVAMMAISGSSKNEGRASVERMKALYVAEAGLSEAILDVNRNGIENWANQGTSS